MSHTRLVCLGNAATIINATRRTPDDGIEDCKVFGATNYCRLTWSRSLPKLRTAKKLTAFLWFTTQTSRQGSQVNKCA